MSFGFVISTCLINYLETDFQFSVYKMTGQSLKLIKFMTDQVTNVFVHVQWPSIISIPASPLKYLLLSSWWWSSPILEKLCFVLDTTNDPYLLNLWYIHQGLFSLAFWCQTNAQIYLSCMIVVIKYKKSGNHFHHCINIQSKIRTSDWLTKGQYRNVGLFVIIIASHFSSERRCGAYSQKPFVLAYWEVTL